MGQTGMWSDDLWDDDDTGITHECPECGGNIFDIQPLADNPDWYFVNCDGCGSQIVHAEYLSKEYGDGGFDDGE